MPYRRLPNTDKTRIKALKSALEQAENLNEGNLAFTFSTLHLIKVILPKFIQAINDQRNDQKAQVTKNKVYIQLLKKYKLYLSHFIQVLNFSIIREEIPAKDLKYFKLNDSDFKVPALNSEHELLEWGPRVIEGEKLRMSHGGKTISNPTAAMVQMHYERFITAYYMQKKLQENNLRAQRKVASYRPEIDSLVLKLWNEIESHFNHLPGSLKRKYSQEYGIVYVYRPHERQKELFAPINTFTETNQSRKAI